MKIKFIYFDFNGVLAQKISDKDKEAAGLFNTHESELEQKTQKLREHQDLDILYRIIRSRKDEEHFLTQRFTILCELFGVNPIGDKLEKYLDIYMHRNHFKLFPDTITTLESLVDKDIRMGILSNSRPSRRTVEIERLGLNRFFPEDLILLSAETGFQKPEEKFFDIAVNRSQTNKENILYIDDKKQFVKAAKKYGIEAIHMGGDIDRISEILKFVI